MKPSKRYDAQVVLERIAKEATNVSAQAGCGAVETAGAVIGYLAENPRDLEPFMVGGIWELPPNWHVRHELTRQGPKGRIIQPAEARQGITLSQLKKGNQAHG
jgi:hypothetical protein